MRRIEYILIAAFCAYFSVFGIFLHSYAAVPDAFMKGFSDIVKKVQPAVVSITVNKGSSGGMVPPGDQGRGRQPSPNTPSDMGSGVIITHDGYVVTNSHVVGGAGTITVTTLYGQEFSARVIGTDPQTDLAVVKVDAENLPAISWSVGTKPKVGDVVLAVGSPFGLTATVTMGIISAIGREGLGFNEYEDFIQTDASINPGNSGGPLINMRGEIIGINSGIFSRSGQNEGIGFAIPVSIAKEVVDDLMREGRVVRGWMGIAIQEMTPELAVALKLPKDQGGALISDVHKDGPSDLGGLMRGDIIIGYGGTAVKTVKDLRFMVARTKVGEEVEIRVLRDGQVKMLIVRIAERPSG